MRNVCAFVWYAIGCCVIGWIITLSLGSPFEFVFDGTAHSFKLGKP